MLFSDHFRALASYIRLNSPEGTQLITRTIQTAESLDYNAIKALLLNCWSAEYALRITPVVNDEQYLQSSLHWTFPQAYYSVLFSSRAFLASRGNNISNEAGIARCISQYVASGLYPHSLGFFGRGIPNNYSTVRLFAQQRLEDFLLETRGNDLNRVMKDLQSNPRKAIRDPKTGHVLEKYLLEPKHWDSIKSTVGRTTFFNLMSRLRISSTDREIEKLVDLDEFNVREFHADLTEIVTHINSVHECYIAQVMGLHDYQRLVDELPSYLQQSFVRERLNAVTMPNVWNFYASEFTPVI
ncbi:hypothetical protein GCM10028818_41230 [Spirosoma horti]